MCACIIYICTRKYVDVNIIKYWYLSGDFQIIGHSCLKSIIHGVFTEN